jgi:hypothetical protein
MGMRGLIEEVDLNLTIAHRAWRARHDKMEAENASMRGAFAG